MTDGTFVSLQDQTTSLQLILGKKWDSFLAIYCLLTFFPLQELTIPLANMRAITEYFAK